MKNLFTALINDVEKLRALSQSKDFIDSAGSSSSRPPRSNIIDRFSFFNINKNSIRIPLALPPTISLESSSTSDTNLLKGKSPMIESGLAQSIVDQTKKEEEESIYKELKNYKVLKKKLEQQIEPEFLAISYRYPPGHSDFINQTFLLTKRMRQKRIDFSSNLDLTKRNCTPGALDLILFNSRKHSFRTKYDTKKDKVWVEVLTSYKGISGKFIVMAILGAGLGAGCIVWYSLLPGIPEGLPLAEILPSRINNHLCTLDDEHLRNVFKKVLFIDLKKNRKGDVQSAYENLYPFSQINIPASGNVKLALGFGVMMAIILGMGITADAPLTSILDILNPSQVDLSQVDPCIQDVARPCTAETSVAETSTAVAEKSTAVAETSTAESSQAESSQTVPCQTIPSTEESSHAGGAAIEKKNKVIEI